MADGPATGTGLARGFAAGGPLDAALPGPDLIRALDEASGPRRRCGGASDDEAFGMLGQWDAAEAWCASGKLGVIRALIRRRLPPGEKLSSAAAEGLIQEVSNQIGISLRAASALISLSADLETRLVLTREALDAGVISLAKARIIAEAAAVLDDEHAAAAETLIADQLARKTPGQIAALIGRAVVKVDPKGAAKRRERAQRENARVQFWREHAGTAALAAFGLPPDEALAANQHIQDRALAYQAAGLPGTIDQLRVRAFLDSLTGIDSRPAPAPGTTAPAPGTTAAVPDTVASDTTASVSDPASAPDTDAAPDTSASTATGTAGTAGTGAGGPGLAAATMLTVPLATLLGLAENPGDAYGWGALDPALARQLAARAACHPGSTWCVTVTDDQGHAVGHGCARSAGTRRKPGKGTPGRGTPGNPGSAPPPGTRDGPAIAFTRTDDHGPPGGYGTWQLRIAGRDYTVSLLPIPVTECDHRYETAGYRPGTLLRHLTEVRDGQCTQPTCVRAARRCDFEHAVPYHKGGRTCACNGGCRCRRDHRVKQSPGWTVTQPRPGYHQWTTPSGRTFTSEPMRYPI